jgi:hypothetical protein
VITDEPPRRKALRSEFRESDELGMLMAVLIHYGTVLFHSDSRAPEPMRKVERLQGMCRAHKNPVLGETLIAGTACARYNCA